MQLFSLSFMILQNFIMFYPQEGIGQDFFL